MTQQKLILNMIRIIENSIYFDAVWYRREYNLPVDTQVAIHYLVEGWRKDNNPSVYFSTSEYLSLNPDVKAADMNPLLHYEVYGRKEGCRYPELEERINAIMNAEPQNNERMADCGILRLRITNRCNAKCRYCGQHCWSEEEQQQEMDPKWYYEYCKPLYEKINMILITGGDAYVAKESYNYMKFMGNNYPKITLMTESNGIAFADRFQQLACEHLFKTHFSINASNAETFVKGCWDGPGGEVAFEKLIANIKCYVNCLKETEKECFAPSLSMVINKDTAHDVVDFARLALSMHAGSLTYYFDYTENNMAAANFGCPETSRPALKQLMEIERVLAKKVHIYFRLWIPFAEAETMQAEVEAMPIGELKEKYRDLLVLADGRSMDEEFAKRNRLRVENGKTALSFKEDYCVTIRLTEIGGKEVCFAPWSEIDLYPNGRIEFCGWYRPTLNIYDFIEENSVNWDHILNSNYYRICRHNILNDNYQGCQTCCPMNNCSSNITPVFKYGYERLEE
jgi:MoaA/NifB/PqqE/SkfB family radical SAM enzyme